MRILIAPDKFAGTLTAVEAAEAIATGWARRAPLDTLDLAPMADGGPGFVDVLHAALGGDLSVVSVSGPLGERVPATILSVDATAYIEGAQACGVHLTQRHDAEAASSFGVGELLLAAIETGARRIVIGLGGSGTTDAGAGLLAALGATSNAELRSGPNGLQGVTEVDLGPALAAVSDVEILAASDVDNPLTGLFGAAKTFGPQKGITEERLPHIDATLEAFAIAIDRKLSLAPGAGSAGGIGFALMALGGAREPGIALVARAVGLLERAVQADLVITGEGAFDFSSRSGKVPYGVAEIAGAALRPCVALAGQVLVGSREMRALGVESAYSLVDAVGEDRALNDSANALTELAERVARTWSH